MNPLTKPNDPILEAKLKEVKRNFAQRIARRMGIENRNKSISWLETLDISKFFNPK